MTNDPQGITFGMSILSTGLQVGGGAAFLYGLMPMSGQLGTAAMGLGALGLVAGLGVGFANTQ